MTEATMSPLERSAAEAEAAALERIRAERLANSNKLRDLEPIAKTLAHLALTKLPEPIAINLRVAKRIYGGPFKLFYKGDDILAEGWILDQQINRGYDSKAATYDGVFLDIIGALRTYQAYDEHPRGTVWYPRDDAVTGWNRRWVDGSDGIDYVDDPEYGKETLGSVNAGQHNAEYITGLLATFAVDHQLITGSPPAV
jgi:hypothetical protein